MNSKVITPPGMGQPEIPIVAESKVLWKASFVLSMYESGPDRVMPWDIETSPLLNRMLHLHDKEAARELEDLFRMRCYDWRQKGRKDSEIYDVRADMVKSILKSPQHLDEIFDLKPDGVIQTSGNLLMYGGASCLWETLEGNGTGTAGQALTWFDNTNAAIGVGDSSTAAAATQTDLQASTNKLRKAMEATYPTHTDATTSGAATVNYKSSFATGEANWAWNEIGVFNSATAATGRMLNRIVQSYGTKASGTWAMEIQITLS